MQRIKTQLITIMAIAAIGLNVLPARESLDPRDTITQALTSGMKNIKIPKRVYRLKPRKEVYLSLNNLQNVTIDFNGAEFIGTVHTRMLEIKNCRNLTLKNLTIDYDPLPFTQGRITKVDQKQNWVIEIIDGYPAKNLTTSGAPIQVYDRKDRELMNPGRHDANALNPLKITRLGKRQFSITGGVSRKGNIGDIVVVNSPDKSPHKLSTIYSTDCVNLRLENIRLYSSPREMGFHEVGNTGTVYRNCIADRRPTETDYCKRGEIRLRSLNKDAFHIKDCSIGPQIIDCTARYQSDDCVNISGMYSVVVSTKGNSLRIVPLRENRISTGDLLQLFTIDGECPPDVKVMSITPDGLSTETDDRILNQLPTVKWLSFHPRKPVYKVLLERPVQLKAGSVVISTKQRGDGFRIEGCTFGHNYSRGLLIKASNGQIVNNEINSCWAAAIKIAPEYNWMEGGLSDNIKITGNRFNSNRSDAIYIGGKSPASGSLPPNAHRNIIINNNTVTDATKGFRLSGCSKLDIRNNTIKITATQKTAALSLSNCEQVREEGNHITLLAPPKIAKKDFMPKVLKVSVNQQILYEAGHKPRTLEIDGNKPVFIEYTLTNTGTEPSASPARVLVHLDYPSGKRATGADYDPLIETTQWGTGKKIVDSAQINLLWLNGKTCKIYLGLFYTSGEGSRLKMAHPEQDNGLRLYVGSLKIKAQTSKRK